MAKKNEQTKSTENKEQIKQDKRTFCYLASKADHMIEIEYNNQLTFIQPYGKIKVVKELIKIVNSDDAKHLTFIKI